MTMPETAIDENDAVPFSKYDIGATRQSGVMEAIAVPESVEKAADDQLRASVFHSDSGHCRATLLRG